MDLKLLTTIAAFVGLGLGLLNISIVVYKDFIRKPKLTVDLEAAEVRWRYCCMYDFKIDMILSARHGDVHLRDIVLQNRYFSIFDDGPPFSSQMDLIADRISENILELTAEEVKVNALMAGAHQVRDLRIKNEESRSMTITTRISPENVNGDRIEIPLDNWVLNVNYGHRIITLPFSFVNTNHDERSRFDDGHMYNRGPKTPTNRLVITSDHS